MFECCLFIGLKIKAECAFSQEKSALKCILCANGRSLNDFCYFLAISQRHFPFLGDLFWSWLKPHFAWLMQTCPNQSKIKPDAATVIHRWQFILISFCSFFHGGFLSSAAFLCSLIVSVSLPHTVSLSHAHQPMGCGKCWAGAPIFSQTSPTFP